MERLHRLARFFVVLAAWAALSGCVEDAAPIAGLEQHQFFENATRRDATNQEAQLVVFSLATSSGAEIPRNLEFLLSRNRLNVAVSRARALAVVVASPTLLEIDCRSIEQMRLVNALCRVAEVGASYQ